MSIVSEDRRGHSGLSVWLIGLAVVLVVALGIWTLAARGGSSRPVLAVGSQRGDTKALMLASGVLDGAPFRSAGALRGNRPLEQAYHPLPAGTSSKAA